MATNLNIDTNLLEQAYEISGLRTKREAVNQALKEFIELHKQKEIVQYFNQIEYDETYDYKKERTRHK